MEPLAELLFDLRMNHRTIPEVEPDLQPADLADGYRHQAALVDAMNGALGGHRFG